MIGGKKQVLLYVYILNNDSGFAPCVQDNWLTLACCKGGIKGGMRMSVTKKFNEGNTIYLLGLCGKMLNRETAYSPIYFAKVDEVLDMNDYYADGGRASGRKDDVYKFVNGELKPKPNNHHSEYDRAKDVGGRYVLCSHQFTYWGDKCGSSGFEIENDLIELFAGIRKRSSVRGHIVYKRQELEKAILNWDWFPKQSDRCNFISKRSIKGDSISRRKC